MDVLKKAELLDPVCWANVSPRQEDAPSRLVCADQTVLFHSPRLQTLIELQTRGSSGSRPSQRRPAGRYMR